MANKTIVISARVSEEAHKQMDSLIEKFQAQSLGKVSQRAIIERALDEMYQKYIKEEE